MVVYDLDNDLAYVVHEAEAIQRALFHIRLTPTRNGQLRGIRAATEYRERWDKLEFGA
jgi:hypothetical protein